MSAPGSLEAHERGQDGRHDRGGGTQERVVRGRGERQRIHERHLAQGDPEEPCHGKPREIGSTDADRPLPKPQDDQQYQPRHAEPKDRQRQGLKLPDAELDDRVVESPESHRRQQDRVRRGAPGKDGRRPPARPVCVGEGGGELHRSAAPRIARVHAGSAGRGYSRTVGCVKGVRNGDPSPFGRLADHLTSCAAGRPLASWIGDGFGRAKGLSPSPPLPIRMASRLTRSRRARPPGIGRRLEP